MGGGVEGGREKERKKEKEGKSQVLRRMWGNWNSSAGQVGM